MRHKVHNNGLPQANSPVVISLSALVWMQMYRIAKYSGNNPLLEAESYWL